MKILATLSLALLSLLPSCSKTTTSNIPVPTEFGAAAAALPDGLFVETLQGDPVPVSQLVASGKAGDEVLMRAVIGGRKEVFVGGRAMFIAVDTALESCETHNMCNTPWDYCCEAPESLMANTLAVQVVDDAGRPLKASLENVGGLKPLADVLVKGTLKSAGDALVLNASQICVVEG